MKILIVEDDKTARKLLSLYIRKKGYEILTAENGLDAMEKVGIEPINLIVTDMNMPYMDGIELTRNLKNDSAFSSIPVIMITTEADEDEKKKAYEAGVDDYLVKPASAEQINNSVKKILKKIFDSR